RWMPDVLLDGEYLPMASAGAAAERLVAFARRGPNGVIVAAAPRLSSGLVEPGRPWPLGEDAWGDTRLPVPTEVGDRKYRNALTGETVATHRVDGELVLRASDLFGHLPVVLLAG